jgi:hypothetical protein
MTFPWITGITILSIPSMINTLLTPGIITQIIFIPDLLREIIIIMVVTMAIIITLRRKASEETLKSLTKNTLYLIQMKMSGIYPTAK